MLWHCVQVWYAVPGHAAEALELAVGDCLPHLTAADQHLPPLPQQVAVSPNELSARGLPVCRCALDTTNCVQLLVLLFDTWVTWSVTWIELGSGAVRWCGEHAAHTGCSLQCSMQKMEIASCISGGGAQLCLCKAPQACRNYFAESSTQ